MPPHAVHMPEHEVAAQPAVGPERALEIDEAPRGSPPSVVTRSVSGPTSACNLAASASDRRQADAIDGNAVARRADRPPSGVAIAEAAPAARRRPPTSSPVVFNQSREHRLPSARRPERRGPPLDERARRANGRPSNSGTPPAPSTRGGTSQPHEIHEALRPRPRAAASAPPSSEQRPHAASASHRAGRAIVGRGVARTCAPARLERRVRDCFALRTRRRS